MLSNQLRHRVAALIALGGVALCCALPARSHEPVTTNVTFSKEVIRILQKHCLGCHRAGGIAGDVVLDSFENARPWAKAIKEEVLERRMPPYQAVTGYGEFVSGYALPQRDVELLVSWIEGGAPRGDEKDTPAELAAPDSADVWPLGQPDLVLQPASETKIAAGEGFEERCFRLPTKLPGNALISGIDFRPGNRAVVYGASFTAESGSGNPACGSGNGLRLGGWVPGQAAMKLPAGTAFVLPSGSQVALTVRYKRGAQATTDRSALAIYLAKGQGARPVGVMRLAAETALLPSGERTRVRAATTLRAATEVIAVRPLLFPLARSVEVTAYRPDGTAEVLAFVKDYRYDWQPAYYLKAPVSLPAGSRVVGTAYLDNSEANPNLPGGPQRRAFKEALCELLAAPAPNATLVSRGGGRRP